MNNIQKIYRTHKAIIKYFIYSFVSTVIDVVVVRILFHLFKLNLVFSNTAGVVCGFAVSYLLSSKSVFNADVGIISFFIFFSTFLLGLAAANILMDTTYRLTVGYLPEILAFGIGKLVSVAIPFFIMFYTRKFLYSKLTEGTKQ